MEPFKFTPGNDPWKAKGADTGTVFDAVDLADGEWVDYDEKGSVGVSVMGIESKFAISAKR